MVNVSPFQHPSKTCPSLHQVMSVAIVTRASRLYLPSKNLCSAIARLIRTIWARHLGLETCSDAKAHLPSRCTQREYRKRPDVGYPGPNQGAFQLQSSLSPQIEHKHERNNINRRLNIPAQPSPAKAMTWDREPLDPDEKSTSTI